MSTDSKVATLLAEGEQALRRPSEPDLRAMHTRAVCAIRSEHGDEAYGIALFIKWLMGHEAGPDWLDGIIGKAATPPVVDPLPGLSGSGGKTPIKGVRSP